MPRARPGCGRSPKSSHATTPTITTWRLPRTVARPAPTASMAWCQNSRSPGEEDAGDRGQPAGPPGQAARSGGARRGRRARAAAARTARDRRSRSTARPPRTGRRRPENAMQIAPASAASRGRRAIQSSGAMPSEVPSRRGGRRAAQPCTSPRRYSGPEIHHHRGSAGGSAWVGRPTKRSPSSSYWLGSGSDGASSIGSLPDWVLGKAMTSRMLV